MWRQDFRRIIRYCKTAQFFQDVPFSYPFTYVVLDHEFPGSKFILTVRDSVEQWYNSLTRFHAKKWGKDGRIPTKENLQQATYLEAMSTEFGWIRSVEFAMALVSTGIPAFCDVLCGQDGRSTQAIQPNSVDIALKGLPWRSNRLRAITPEDDPYNKDLLIADYINYNKTVQDYFQHRSTDLLVLNVADEGAYAKLTEFLGIETDKTDFPWKNKT